MCPSSRAASIAGVSVSAGGSPPRQAAVADSRRANDSRAIKNCLLDIQSFRRQEKARSTTSGGPQSGPPIFGGSYRMPPLRGERRSAKLLS